MAISKKQLTPVKVCMARFTRLNEDGTVVDDDDNSYVTDTITEVAVSPQIIEGNTIELPNGCGCLLVSLVEDPQPNGYEITVTNGRINAELRELLLGTPVVSWADGTGLVAAGNQNPIRGTCGVRKAGVAAEFWQQAIDYDDQDPDYPFVHYVFPKVVFHEADFTMNNDATTKAVTGRTRESAGFGEGPYDDLPEASDVNGMWFFDTDMPEAVVGYQTVAVP